METLTRVVTESLARHGFDRPIDYRRLQWSHWFRCESHHSLLVVPSKPGVFALAEELMNIPDRVGTGPLVRSASPILSEAKEKGGAPLPEAGTREPKAETTRMLAVAKFFEDDDMAYVLDRMLSHPNPMQARLASGRYFIRFVAIEDPSQRHSVCTALNQWIASSAEKTTGIGSHFSTSLELTTGSAESHIAVPSDTNKNSMLRDEVKPKTAPTLNSAVATTIHCSSSFPSGF